MYFYGVSATQAYVVILKEIGRKYETVNITGPEDYTEGKVIDAWSVKEGQPGILYAGGSSDSVVTPERQRESLDQLRQRDRRRRGRSKDRTYLR